MRDEKCDCCDLEKRRGEIRKPETRDPTREIDVIKTGSLILWTSFDLHYHVEIESVIVQYACKGLVQSRLADESTGC